MMAPFRMIMIVMIIIIVVVNVWKITVHKFLGGNFR